MRGHIQRFPPIFPEQMMKKVLTVLAILGLVCLVGCAPSDNGGADDSDNTTSQIRTERVQNVIARV